MLGHIAPLNELPLILLFDGHEHPHDVAQQVTAALGNTVEEHGACERRLRKAAILLIQRIGLDGDGGHIGPTHFRSR